jgi:hypothetical protein
VSPPAEAARPSVERLIRWLPALLFAFALLLRLAGIGWGLANDVRHASLHPDEPVIWLYSQNVEPARLDFDPGFYNYGTLYLTMLRVAGDMVAVYSGLPENPTPAQEWAQISKVHVAGRILSALAGAGTVLVVFLLARRFTTPMGAVFAALLVALAPGHVVHSRFQTVDVLATFFLALSALFALKLLRSSEGQRDAAREGDDLRVVLWAGAFAGLSTGTKYTGLLGLLTLFAALAIAKHPRAVKLAALGTATAIGVFVLSTPGVLINTATFMEHFRYEMTHTATGHGLVFEGTPPGFVFHLLNLFEGVGLMLTLLGLGGLGYAAYLRKPWSIALLAFFLPYYLLIGRAEVTFLRYTFPLYIALALGFGWLVAGAHRAGGWRRLVVALGIAGLGGLDPGGLRGSAQATAWMMGEDPRDSAARYMRQAAEGSRGDGPVRVGLVSDPWFYTPPLYPEANYPLFIPFEARMEAMARAERPSVVRFLPENPRERYDWDVRLLEELMPEFVSVASFEQRDLERLAGQQNLRPEVQLQVERARVFSERLRELYVFDRQFGEGYQMVHDMEYIRPTVWIWRKRDLP